MDHQDILNAVFKEATVGMLIVNQGGKIVKINPFAEKMFGYEKGILENKQLEILVPQAFRTAHIQHRQNYNKNPEPRLMGAQLELFGLRKNDVQFPVEISLSYIKKRNGTISYCLY